MLPFMLNMRKTTLAVLGCALLAVGVAAPSATTAPAARQLELPLPLLAPGDRAEIGYDAPGTTGALYVRNDLQPTFTRVPLTLRKGAQQVLPSDQLKLLRAVVPARLVRGHELLYYALVHRPGGRSVRIPGGAPQSARVLDGAAIVRLGAHRFGHPRAAEAVVARAGPGDVKFEDPAQGPQFGPQSFQIGADRSVWLLDELNDRLLVWRPGAPMRTVPLPFLAFEFALGPAGSVYVTRPGVPPALPDGLNPIRLARVSSTGVVMWQSKLATDVSNNQLRVAPGGTLYWTGPFPSPGSERRWTPATTPAGRPLSFAQQDRGSLFGYQPLAGGLRLMQVRASAHEIRVALVDRGGTVVHAWRIMSTTPIAPTIEATPDLVAGDPVVVIETMTGSEEQHTAKWEYVVLRLSRTGGLRTSFSLAHVPPRAAWGDIVTDVRVGPDGKLYQMGSSPATGVTISRYSLG